MEHRRDVSGGAIRSSTTKCLEPLGVLTISTHGRGELVTGSARVVSEGPIGGMLRFEHPAAIASPPREKKCPSTVAQQTLQKVRRSASGLR